MREAITVQFRGQHQGMYRTLPTRETRGGLEWSLRLDRIHVFDEAHRSLRADVSYPGPYVRIATWLPGAAPATRTLTIVYRVRRGLLAWADLDELYWNVTGNEWEVPIQAAEVVVVSPPGVPDDVVRAVAYVGHVGASGRDYVEERGGRTVRFRTTRSLWPREGLTVVVGWPPGYFRRPPAWLQAWWWVGDNWPLGLPVLAFGCMTIAWWTHGRDPASRRSVKPEYEPPAGLIPAEAGALVDERAEPRDVVATIVDLAVRGYLNVERVTTAFDETDFMFKRLRPVEGDPALKPLELFILARLFGADWKLNLRLLSEIRRDYDNVFPPIRDAVYRSMVADRLFPASPETVKKIWAAVGGVLMTAGLASLASPPYWLGPWARLLPAGVAASGAVVALLSRIMPRRTLHGARLLVHVLGFQEFLERAEKDRLARMPADTLHRLLPWAIALGVTERWIVNFEGLDVDPPFWFASGGPFTLGGFQRDLTRFDWQTEDAIRTSRRTGGTWSVLGGSAGPRSSGRGFGGGGGGTF